MADHVFDIPVIHG